MPILATFMQNTKKKLIISIVVAFISTFISIDRMRSHHNKYFELTIKYAETASERNDGYSVSHAVPSPLSNTRTDTKPVHCIQYSPVGIKDPHYAIDLHPVSRLYEIQAKLHQSEPKFKDIGHGCDHHDQNKSNRKYHVQVMVNNKSTSAWSHTKREAKRQAAIAMLKLMGLPVEGDDTNVIC